MNEPTEIALMKQSMENLTTKFDDFKKDNQAAHKEMIEMFQKAINEKAGKWVEDTMKWGITLILGIVLSAVVYLVIKK